MIGATLFSGIGAAEQAIPGWRWLWHAEIERFPSAVMAARHPLSVNLGDVCAEDFVERALAAGRPDVVVFGSPCQDFSIAGKRVGLDGARGNLALVALGVLARLKPRWFVFENVPGLLSSFSGSAEAERQVREGPIGARADCDEDRDLAAFLSLVSDIGYHGCWDVLDSQWRGVAQRRERLFFVGHARDWRGPAAVLFEPEGLRGDRPPSREAGQRIAGTISARTEGGGGLGTDFDLAGGLVESARPAAFGISGDCFDRSGEGAGGTAAERSGLGVEWELAYALRAKRAGAVAFDTTQITSKTNRCQPQADDACHPLAAGAHPPAIAYGGNNTGGAINVATAVRAKGGTGHGDFESETFVLQDGRAMDKDQNGRGWNEGGAMYTLDGTGAQAVAFKPSHYTRGKDGEPSSIHPPLSADADKGDQDALVLAPVAYRTSSGNGRTYETGDHIGALPTGTDKAHHVLAFQTRIARNGRGQPSEVVPALNGADAGDTSDMRPCVAVDAGDAWAVRRLMPVECERLQGFPDGYTDVLFRGNPAADGPRYKALGNSMTVSVIRWILERIEIVDAIMEEGR